MSDSVTSLTVILWFFFGIVVGVILASFAFMLIQTYGDPETEELIDRIRRERIEVEAKRLKEERGRLRLAMLKRRKKL